MSQQACLPLLFWLSMYPCIHEINRSKQARTVLQERRSAEQNKSRIKLALKVGFQRVFTVQNGYSRTLNLQLRDELGSGQETAQISYGSLAKDGRLRWVLQDLPQVIQEGLSQSLNLEKIHVLPQCDPIWVLLKNNGNNYSIKDKLVSIIKCCFYFFFFFNKLVSECVAN